MHSVVNKISQTTNSPHVPFFPKQHEGARKNKPQLSSSLDHELGWALLLGVGNFISNQSRKS
jgi:hypothetical protein